ncbi:transposase [Streptomyces sp. AK02-04a]|uniref:transposase n=1 Tax=Streptomyces sp. AK02-04a TaxID=3028649 RepID=UPI0039F5688C
MTCTHNCWRSALKRSPDTGPSPVGRRKTGSNHHLIGDGHGTPLKVITTAANVNDVTQTLALVDGIPPITGRPGRTLRRQSRCAEWAVVPRRSWATTAVASPRTKRSAASLRSRSRTARRSALSPPPSAHLVETAYCRDHQLSAQRARSRKL